MDISDSEKYPDVYVKPEITSDDKEIKRGD